MALTPRTGGTTEQLAVSLGEIKLHLRITHELEDGDLEMRAWASQRAISAYVGPIVQSEWDWTLDRFRCGCYLSLPAYKSVVTGMAYRTPADITTPFADYVADNDSRPGRIFLATGKSWPSAELRRAGGVVVQLECGWPVDAVPAPLKAAILLDIGHLYANRESVVTDGTGLRELPRGVASLVEPYRVFDFGWLPECLS